MREMKDSGIEWIGEIPADWETRKIKQLADSNTENSFVDGDWIESPYIVDSGIRYLTTGNIGDGVFKEQGNGYITLKTFGELACKYAFPGDLIISRLNAPYGRSCILPSDYTEYVVAVDNVILRTQEDKRYICYVSQCDGYKHAVEDDAKGTTMKRISRINLGNIVIPLPPIQQQHRIADYLDRKCSQIDAIIARQQEVIEKLKAYKLSVITEAVTKGLNPDVPMKDSGVKWVGEIPKHWILNKLKYLSLDIGDGIHATPTYDVDGNIYFVNGNNIGEEYLVFKEDTNTISETEYASYKLPLLTENTVFITLNGATYGKTSFYHGEKILMGKSAGFITLKPNENREFIRYYLQSYTAKLIMDLSLLGSTIANLSLRTLRDFVIPYPPIEEQIQIVNHLNNRTSSIDTAVSKKEKIVDALIDYKKSLIYEVVTGKKEV